MVAPEVQPAYAGYVGWRGLVEEAEFSPEFAPRRAKRLVSAGGGAISSLGARLDETR